MTANDKGSDLCSFEARLSVAERLTSAKMANRQATARAPKVFQCDHPRVLVSCNSELATDTSRRRYMEIASEGDIQFIFPRPLGHSDVIFYIRPMSSPQFDGARALSNGCLGELTLLPCAPPDADLSKIVMRFAPTFGARTTIRLRGRGSDREQPSILHFHYYGVEFTP